MDTISDLTQLYTDTKKSCDLVADEARIAQRFRDLNPLHLQFCIQRERLSAWGYEWGDETSPATTQEDSIDEAVEKAGLTSTVRDVLQRIKVVLEEAEQLKTFELTGTSRSIDNSQLKRQSVVSLDKTRYEQLAKELTASIDLLYDLSSTRRVLRQGTYPEYSKPKLDRALSVDSVPSFSSAPVPPSSPPWTHLSSPPTKISYTKSSFSDSSETLLNPSVFSSSRASTLYTRASSIELPSRLDPSLLELTDEQPPPYDRIGATQSSRMIAYLKQPHLPSSNDHELVKIPVLIEYAPFDPAYRATQVSPPSDRLDALLSLHAHSVSPFDPSHYGLLSCLGYFEDTKDSRYGLVYEIPKFASTPSTSTIPSTTLGHSPAPTSLLKMLQASSRLLNKDSPQNLPTGPALENRFRMAFNLVNTISRMHTDELLAHKDINSGNIIFFPKRDARQGSTLEYDVRSPYLTSFDLFSEFNLEYSPMPTTRNIYRSPDDPKVTESCSLCSQQSCKCRPFRFDLYSLSLVLLEIAHWTPLADIFKSKYTLENFKHRIETVWIKRLSSKCGSTYMKVVREMMSTASTNISEESLVTHYSRWLSMLQKCCSIDDSEDISSITSSLTNSSLMNESRSWSPKSVQKSFKPTTLPRSITEDVAEDSNSLKISQLEPFQKSKLCRNANAVLENASSNKTKSTSSSTFDEQNNSNVMPFREYRKNIVLIQKQWRKRQSNLTSSTISSGNPSQYYSTYSSQHEIIEHNVVHNERNTEQQKQEQEQEQEQEQQEQPKRRVKLYIHNVKPQAKALHMWSDEIQPALEKLVDRALRNSPESVSIDLFMVGPVPEESKPTIFITCNSITRVKYVLSRKFNYDANIFDLKFRKGRVKRSKATRVQKSSPPPPHRSMADREQQSQLALNPYHQKRPLCGASIGAFTNKHLPPVSFGGMINVDGELYGMTVHHLLDDPSDEDDEDDEDDGHEENEEKENSADENDSSEHRTHIITRAPRSSSRGFNHNNNFNNFNDFAGIGSRYTPSHTANVAAPSIPPINTIFTSEIEDEEPSDNDNDVLFDDADMNYDSDAFSDNVDAETPLFDVSTPGTQGDTLGIHPDNDVEPEFIVTQPALDDVEDDFFPELEDRDDDHLDSHTLGHIHASSGLKRWRRNGVLHEIDWALLKLRDDRLQPCNLVQGGRKYYRTPESRLKEMKRRLREPIARGQYSDEMDEYPTEVASSDQLGNLPVHCFGRTSGLQGGVIGPAMSSVRIYKRRSFSRSWIVMGDFGVGGDSGAWVIDNDRGRVVGHVLAWCQRFRIAYICPADVLFEDMKRVLGARRICLPGSDLEHGRSPLRACNEFDIKEKEDIHHSQAAVDAAVAAHRSGVIAQADHESNLVPQMQRLTVGGADRRPTITDGNNSPPPGAGLAGLEEMLTSRLNGNPISPRSEVRRVFGDGGVAR